MSSVAVPERREAAPERDGPPRAALLVRVADTVRAWSPATWAGVDVAVALVTFGALTVPAALGVPTHEGHPAAALALGAAASLPLAVRRRWPVPVLAVITAATVAALLLGVRTTPFVSNAGPGVGLAMYTVASRARSREEALNALGVVAAATGILNLVAMALYPEQDHNAVHSLAAVAGWFVGDTVRTQRAYEADLAARSRAEAGERTRRAAAEERLRLAREVHDVVSHSLSLIAVRSGVGRMVAREQPDEAVAALATIEETSRSALDELRRLLRADRSAVSADAAAVDRSSVAPMPGLADLPELADRMAEAGVPVDLRVGPDADDAGATVVPPALLPALPPLLELSAHRIVQESLTNVLRHAGHVPATVTVTRAADALEVEVTDPGAGARPPGGTGGPAGPGSGLGLAGMAERVALYGGTLDAGPRPGGGWRVHARLPLAPPGEAPVRGEVEP
jgi:signal transduction histidine kinase